MTEQFVKKRLDSFNKESYRDPYSRLAYLTAILHNRRAGLEEGWIPKLRFSTNEKWMVNFFASTDLPLQSALAQFTQLVVAEDSYEQTKKSSLQGRKLYEVSISMQERIKQEDERLQLVKRIREEMGKEIFGGKDEKYTQAFLELFFAMRNPNFYPTRGIYAKRKIRDDSLINFVGQVKEEFPLTSMQFS